MPELKWNEYDFVECLGVLSKFDEEWAEHSFEYERDELILKIFIRSYASLVTIYLSQESSKEPFLKFPLIVRGEIQYVNEKNTAYLRFLECVISDSYGDEFDRNKYPSYTIFEIHTFPKFQLKFT